MSTEVFGPEKWAGCPDLAADIMIKLLVANYGKHNITNDRATLVADIRDGTLLPWITRDETACAALIKQSDSDVEIGRAACNPRTTGGNSGPIMEAVARWKGQEVFSSSMILRAEVRTAKPTKEVPGGQATQAIVLRKLEFNPTAIGPFFHHGIPDRQEMFMLANIAKNTGEVLSMAQGIVMPDSVFLGADEREMFGKFWRINFNCDPRIIKTEISDKTAFLIQDVGPFVVLTPSQSGVVDWKSTITKHFELGHRFALAKLNLNKMDISEVSRGAIELRNEGFRLVGFEPVLEDGNWTMELLMGKLSSTGRINLVLPSFSEGVVSHEMEENLLKVSINWRKNE